MKISKLFAITLQTKTRLIFFAIASAYNLLLGLYLKDFLVLSQTLTAFYLLSALSSLFLAVEIKTKATRTAVYIICANCETAEEKVKAIYKWMIHNFEYDYECEPIVQYFNVRKTLSRRKGICYDFSHLFAALCRSQNIPCYVVDGDKRDNIQYHHTWNRVYFDDSWWDTDVTFDIIQTKNQGKLYGFREIENHYSLEEEYYITKIY